MTKVSRKNSRGFTFVELLAVVLVLAVLAAVAIPIYMNSRRSSAARTCKANIGTIARALASYALRNGTYPINVTALEGQPEGIETDLRCPLTQTDTYQLSASAGGAALGAATTGAIFVQCTNATGTGGHAAHTGVAVTEWQKPLPAIPTEPGGIL